MKIEPLSESEKRALLETPQEEAAPDESDRAKADELYVEVLKALLERFNREFPDPI